ncbi:MAG: hypothetical protein PHD76_02740 [Methylacidiphilales bacterium]|nr:hypothetical protein [Candidatus Methylacidiphilales bacterium]
MKKPSFSTIIKSIDFAAVDAGCEEARDIFGRLQLIIREANKCKEGREVFVVDNNTREQLLMIGYLGKNILFGIYGDEGNRISFYSPERFSITIYLEALQYEKQRSFIGFSVDGKIENLNP